WTDTLPLEIKTNQTSSSFLSPIIQLNAFSIRKIIVHPIDGIHHVHFFFQTVLHQVRLLFHHHFCQLLTYFGRILVVVIHFIHFFDPACFFVICLEVFRNRNEPIAHFA